MKWTEDNPGIGFIDTELPEKYSIEDPGTKRCDALGTGTEGGNDMAKKKELSVADLTYIGVFAAIISVLAQISIPMPAGVPMTLQTFAIPLAGVVLGRKRGFLAALVYVLLGAVGVPVFAGFTGGLGIVLGITGGFIVSFPLMAYLAGLGMERSDDASRVKLPLWGGLLIGAALNYAVGTVWFMIAAQASLVTALTGCVVPFIPTGVIMLVLAGLVGLILRLALLKAGILKPADQAA